MRCWGMEGLRVVRIIAVLALVVVVVAVVVESSAVVRNHADPPASPTQQHDVCVDDGAALRCPQGHVLHVQGARCPGAGGGLRPCGQEVVDTLQHLCQGRASCAGLGLRQVFGTLCHHHHSPSARERRVVVVSYACRRHAPDAAPACGANLCSNVTQGLRCPKGSLLHVRGARCEAGRVTCAGATSLMLYWLCEGRQSCDASGLRQLKPLSMYCGHSVHPRLQHVFVDFVCVPDDLIHNQCRPNTVTLTAAFGVLMSPGFAGPAGGTPSHRARPCDWLLALRDPDDVVHVLVHTAYSRWQARDCHASHFLRVDYKDCDSQERITREFCDLSDVDVAFTSCGSVHVTSSFPADSGDNPRFLLSYQMLPRGSGVASPRGMEECRTPLAASPLATPQPPTFTQPRTTRPNFSRRNYGPGRTMFDYSDTIRHMGSDSETNDSDSDDTFQLKLILLYVFFGVVIMALVIALIYVLMSYRGISNRGRHGSDSSEKTALWRHEDTPLHTFSQNSHATLAEVANWDFYPPSPQPQRHQEGEAEENKDNAGSPGSKVVACTVHAKSTGKEEEEEEEEAERRLSTGSAFSSFLSGKDMDLQDLLDSFHTPTAGSAPPARDGGDYDIIGLKDHSQDYDSIGRKDSGDYDIIAGVGDYDSIADVVTADGVPRREGGGEDDPRSSPKNTSFLLNGDVGNIYESIEDQRCRHFGLMSGGYGQGDVVTGPPVLPPSHPCSDPTHPSYVEHYTINDDDYALVRKPKGCGGAAGGGGGSGGGGYGGPTRYGSNGQSATAMTQVGHNSLSHGHGTATVYAVPADKDLNVKWGEHI